MACVKSKVQVPFATKHHINVCFCLAGVGQLVDRTELNNIVAPYLDRVFLFDDFAALNARLEAITVEVCETGTVRCAASLLWTSCLII